MSRPILFYYPFAAISSTSSNWALFSSAASELGWQQLKKKIYTWIDFRVASTICVRGLFPWWWQSKWAKDEVTLTVSFISFGKAVPVDGAHLLLAWRRCAEQANENAEKRRFLFSQQGINVSISFLYWAAVSAESAGLGEQKGLGFIFLFLFSFSRTCKLCAGKWQPL